jgi:hypothetical protein
LKYGTVEPFPVLDRAPLGTTIQAMSDALQAALEKKVGAKFSSKVQQVTIKGGQIVVTGIKDPLP